jgi:hypothetical protein
MLPQAGIVIPNEICGQYSGARNWAAAKLADTWTTPKTAAIAQSIIAY